MSVYIGLLPHLEFGKGITNLLNSSVELLPLLSLSLMLHQSCIRTNHILITLYRCCIGSLCLLAADLGSLLCSLLFTHFQCLLLCTRRTINFQFQTLQTRSNLLSLLDLLNPSHLQQDHVVDSFFSHPQVMQRLESIAKGLWGGRIVTLISKHAKVEDWVSWRNNSHPTSLYYFQLLVFNHDWSRLIHNVLLNLQYLFLALLLCGCPS